MLVVSSTIWPGMTFQDVTLFPKSNLQCAMRKAGSMEVLVRNAALDRLPGNFVCVERRMHDAAIRPRIHLCAVIIITDQKIE